MYAHASLLPATGCTDTVHILTAHERRCVRSTVVRGELSYVPESCPVLGSNSPRQHCQQMAPEYSKAAGNLSPLVPFYAIDCDAESNKPLCASQVSTPAVVASRPVAEHA